MLKPMHETVARLEYRTSNASSHLKSAPPRDAIHAAKYC
jgi:hypothetical protein